VKCYAEYPEDSAAYKQLKQLADFGTSDAFADERGQLSKQAGMFGYTTGMFSDASIDAAKKLNNTYQIGTRLVGTGKMALGVGGVVGSALTAPVSCATVIGCFANGAAATISLDAAYSGGKQLISGNPTETYLNQGLQSLGMSPKAAAWVEAGLGIGSAATAWSVANKAVDQSIAIGKLSAATYHDFAPNGLVPTSDVMSMPQAQLLMKEIQNASPGLSDTMTRNIAQEIIQSGSALPRIDVASASTMLIKVVPKGSGVSDFSPYWMTVDQARIITNSSAEQAAQILGLPAAQAGKMLKDGMDFFAIAPKAGLQPTVFVSDIASTTQGAYSTAPKAQQVIVPNRTLWTPATPINPLTIK
jgi:filamentous hemagglutinin